MPFIMIWLWIEPYFCSILDLGPILRQISFPLQSWCAAQISPGIHSELTAAMVCGIDPSSSAALVFQQSGLYHLLVVSGGHLAFFVGLMQPLERRRLFSWVILIFLIFYTLLCGAQPPVVRALLQWFLSQHRHKLGLHSHSALITWYSGILCLSLVPSWVHSLSFWLSWLATLACQAAVTLQLSTGLSVLLIHLVLLPGLLNLGSAHPLSVVNNWLFAPLLSGALLPLCLLTTFIPPLTFLSDGAWSLLLSILEPLNQLATTTSEPVSKSFLIFYVLLMQILAWQGWIWWQRSF